MTNSHYPSALREKQITELIKRGKTNKEIAWELRLTEGTIKGYLLRIFRKFKVKHRTQLAMTMIAIDEAAARVVQTPSDDSGGKVS